MVDLDDLKRERQYEDARKYGETKDMITGKYHDRKMKKDMVTGEYHY